MRRDTILFFFVLLSSSLLTLFDPWAFGIIFVICWLLMVGSMLLSFIETFGCRRLYPWSFAIGPVATVIEEEMDCPPGLSVVADVKSSSVAFRVLNHLRCIFRQSWFPFVFRWHTPFEIKGTLSWSDKKLRIIGRYPLGTTLAFLAWVDSWTVFGVFVLFDQGDLLGLALLAFGWIFGALLIPSKRLELKRFKTVAEEVRTILQGTEVATQS